MSKILVAGAGGFIGGHLVQGLLNEGHEVHCADVKPFEYWFQIYNENKNFSLDLKEFENCLKVTSGVDYVFNMACNMGGMGFIENNKAECMLSVLINTNLLRSCKINSIKKYFFLQAHVFIILQNKAKFLFPDLKRKMPILQTLRMDMDGKNFFQSECVGIFQRIFNYRPG